MTYGTRRGWGVSVTPRPLFTPGKDPVPIVQEDGWATGPVWTGAENLASTGIRYPDRSARSQLLYRLRYPAHSKVRYYIRTNNVQLLRNNTWYTLNLTVTYLLHGAESFLRSQPVNFAASQEIPRTYWTRKSLTVPTSARHLSLSWANPIQSPRPPPTSWRSILILSSHLRVVDLIT